MPMPAIDSEEVAARRVRLAEWIKRHYGADKGAGTAFLADFRRLAREKGLPATLAQPELSLLVKPNGKSFGEKKARDIERVLSMPPNYLLAPLDLDHQKRRLRVAETTGCESSAASGTAWLSYMKANPATMAAVDLLLLPPRERKALMKRDKLVSHLIEQLELHAKEALNATKSA